MNYSQAVESLNLPYQTLKSIIHYYHYCMNLNQIPDFSNNDYTFMIFEGINLAGSNFSGCNFKGSSLVNANFANCNLTNTNFNIADLQGANLAGSDITGANFNSANLERANFSNVHTTSSSGGKTLVKFEYFEQFNVKGIVNT